MKSVLEVSDLSEEIALTVHQILALLSKFQTVDAIIYRKVLELLQQWRVSGANVEPVRQQVEALLRRVQQLIKSNKITTADVQAILQQLLGSNSGLNTSVADVAAATVEDWENLVNISELTAAFNQLMGLVNALGISKADVEFALETVIDFIRSTDFAAVLAPLAEGQSFLVDMDICSILEAEFSGSDTSQ